MTIDQILAVKQYISSATDSSGYSMSQNLNHKLENNIPLNANEQYMLQLMNTAMHPIGVDTVLHRGAHQDLLQRLGVNNYDRMTEAQLNSVLVGKTMTTTSFTSTSYDYSKNPFLGSGPQAGGREVELKINAGKNTNVILANKKQAETILGIGTNFKIKGVRFTGRTASPRTSSRSLPVLEIEIDTF